MDADFDHHTRDESGGPGLGTLIAAALLYAVCVVVATWPVAWTIRTDWPSSIDALQHLRTMRWYKTCLLEGRNPFFMPEIHYPTGVPLGYFSPMQIQAAAYFPLSCMIANDVLIYNLIWFASLIFTGIGTFVLAWSVVRDRGAALVAGLVTMIGTPILMHAHGHLELINVGFVPLFFAAWMRLCDRPSLRSALVAVACYLLATMSAAYFGILATFPAIYYLLWRAFTRKPDVSSWIRSRLGPLLVFGGMSAVGLAVLFAPQFWAESHGFPMARPRSQFESYGTTVWSYFLPTSGHFLGSLMPVDVYRLTGLTGEGYSYVGIVVLLMLHRVWVRRAQFSRSGFWWSVLGLMVVLSLGAKWHWGSWQGSLPAGWLHHFVKPFRVIRVPARFNIFASICASVIVAVGVKDWLATLRTSVAKRVLLSGLMLVAVRDLAAVPFGTERPPTMPLIYGEILRRDSTAGFHDAPHIGYAGAHLLPAACGYWQSLHGGRTISGYSSNTNSPGDALTTWASPFFVGYLMNPHYLDQPGQVQVDAVGNLDFVDYCRLFLDEHHLRYVVFHRSPDSLPGFTLFLDPVLAKLRPFLIHEDARTLVYDRDLMPLPQHPTPLCTRGWLTQAEWRGRTIRPLAKSATIVVSNPRASQDLVLMLAASAFRRTRVVRLLGGDREIARWEIPRDPVALYTTTPFRLPAGRSELTLQSDGDDPPFSPVQEIAEGDRTAYSLRVQGLILRPAELSDFGDVTHGESPRLVR